MPKSLPMLEKLDVDRLEFSFTENGRMNLERGEFETEAGVISLPKPFDTWTIRACEDCPKPEPLPPRSSVELWVNCVAPHANSSEVADNPPENDEITICPKDPILLSWEASSDVTSCKLEPGIGGVPS